MAKKAKKKDLIETLRGLFYKYDVALFAVKVNLPINLDVFKITEIRKAIAWIKEREELLEEYCRISGLLPEEAWKMYAALGADNAETQSLRKIKTSLKRLSPIKSHPIILNQKVLKYMKHLEVSDE